MDGNVSYDDDNNNIDAEMNESKENTDNDRNQFRLACANARSLNNKSLSLINLFEETNLNICALNETWIVNSDCLEERLEDIALGENISLIRRDRMTGRGGGVAIAFHNKKMKMSEYTIARNASPMAETVAAIGTDIASGTKVLIVSVYLPPALKKQEVLDVASDISDTIACAKTKYKDLIIYVAGDMNQKRFGSATADFPDIKLLKSGPTRKNKCLDLIYTNAQTVETLTMEPLESEEGVCSDHRVLYTAANIKGTPSPRGSSCFFVRRIDPKRKEKFTKELLDIDWSIIEEDSVHESTEELTRVLDTLVAKCFPLKKITIRSRDLPWITPSIKRTIRRRKRRYKKYGRDPRWKELKKLTEQMIADSKKKYIERVEEKCRMARNSQAYFQAVKRLNCKEAPIIWSIMQMYPDKSEIEIAELVAEFFNSISNEYVPLEQTELHEQDMPKIEMFEIAARLRSCKKPKSQVEGDIPPQVIKENADILAIPLSFIYNKAIETGTWPNISKKETVTVIPKNSAPSALGELRILSCTPLFSKVLEFFILQNLMSDIKLSSAQHGGIKGISTDHFLIGSWHKILEHLEDANAAANVLSVDFEKAFNRMDHSECLNALSNMGASQYGLRMVRAFLTERFMSVKRKKGKPCLLLDM